MDLYDVTRAPNLCSLSSAKHTQGLSLINLQKMRKGKRYIRSSWQAI